MFFFPLWARHTSSFRNRLEQTAELIQSTSDKLWDKCGIKKKKFPENIFFSLREKKLKKYTLYKHMNISSTKNCSSSDIKIYFLDNLWIFKFMKWNQISSKWKLTTKSGRWCSINICHRSKIKTIWFLKNIYISTLLLNFSTK